MSSSNPTKGSSSSDAKRKQEASKSKGKVGDWFRHISSSGKEYYFNVQTHASQWEKPDVWIDYEKKYGPVPSHPTPTKPTSSSTSHAQQRPHQHQHQQHQSDSHSQQQHQHSIHNEREKEQQQQQRDRDRQNQHHQQHHHHSNHSNSITSSSSAAGHSNSSYQGGQTFSHNFNVSSNKPQSSNNSGSISHTFHHHNLASSSRSLNHSFDHHHSSNNINNSSSISNSGQKHSNYPESLTKHPTFPPSSLSSSTRDSRKQSEDLQADDMDISPIDTDSPTDMKIITNPIITPSSSRDHGGRMDSYGGINNNNNKNHSMDSSMDTRDRDRDRDRDDNRSISSSSYHRGGIGNNGYHNRDRDRDRYRDSPRNHSNRGGVDYRDRERDRDRGRVRDRDQRERDRERSRSKLRDERSRSPWERDGTPERHGEPSSGGGGLSSLSSLATLNPMEKSEDPLLSMAKYYREDLIEHIKNPMADSAEKQSNKLSEDILHTTAILLSKVSTELKMARGLVRLTEIQATLQEQRILFLREQIKTLQESGKDSSTRME